jgi:hypothetical protein
MRPLFPTITDLALGVETIRRGRHGVIEVVDGQFRGVTLRPWPALVSMPYVLLTGRWQHRRLAGNRCVLYYNQPRRWPNFLTLQYAISSRDCSLASGFRALEVLEEIARIKQSDALLADVTNWRISERLLARLGWEAHCPSQWHRHYIKRFYGVYPPRPEWLKGG